MQVQNTFCHGNYSETQVHQNQTPSQSLGTSAPIVNYDNPATVNYDQPPHTPNFQTILEFIRWYQPGYQCEPRHLIHLTDEDSRHATYIMLKGALKTDLQVQRPQISAEDKYFFQQTKQFNSMIDRLKKFNISRLRVIATQNEIALIQNYIESAMKTDFPQQNVLDLFVSSIESKDTQVLQLVDLIEALLIQTSQGQAVEVLDFMSILSQIFSLTPQEVVSELITVVNNCPAYPNPPQNSSPEVAKKFFKCWRQDARKHYKNWCNITRFGNHDIQPNVVLVPQVIQPMNEQIFAETKQTILQSLVSLEALTPVVEKAGNSVAKAGSSVHAASSKLVDSLDLCEPILGAQIPNTLENINRTTIHANTALKETSKLIFDTKIETQATLDQLQYSIQNITSSAIHSMSEITESVHNNVDLVTQKIIKKMDEVLPSSSTTAESVPVVHQILTAFKNNKVLIIANVIDARNCRTVDGVVIKLMTIGHLLGLNSIVIEKFISIFKKLMTSIQEKRKGMKEQADTGGILKAIVLTMEMLGQTTDTFSILSKILTKITSLSNKFNGTSEAWTSVQEILHHLGIYSTSDQLELQAFKDDLKALIENVSKYEALLKTMPSKFCVNSHYSKFKSDLKRVQEIENRIATKYSKMPNFQYTKEIMTLSLRIHRIAPQVEQIRQMSKTRPQPYAFSFLGWESGIGKSYAQDNLLEMLRMRFKENTAYFDKDGNVLEKYACLEDLDEWRMWAQNTADQYHQGYIGQEAHHITDAFMAKDQMDHNDYISFIGTNPFLTKQAELDQKGTPYNSRYIALSSNTFPVESVKINNVHALQRRFTLYHFKKVHNMKVPTKNDPFDPSFKWVEITKQSATNYADCHWNKSHKKVVKVMTITDVLDDIIENIAINDSQYKSTQQYFGYCAPKDDESLPKNIRYVPLVNRALNSVPARTLASLVVHTKDQTSQELKDLKDKAPNIISNVVLETQELVTETIPELATTFAKTINSNIEGMKFDKIPQKNLVPKYTLHTDPNTYETSVTVKMDQQGDKPDVFVDDDLDSHWSGTSEPESDTNPEPSAPPLSESDGLEEDSADLDQDLGSVEPENSEIQFFNTNAFALSHPDDMEYIGSDLFTRHLFTESLSFFKLAMLKIPEDAVPTCFPQSELNISLRDFVSMGGYSDKSLHAVFPFLQYLRIPLKEDQIKRRGLPSKFCVSFSDDIYSYLMTYNQLTLDEERKFGCSVALSSGLSTATKLKYFQLRKAIKNGILKFFSSVRTFIKWTGDKMYSACLAVGNFIGLSPHLSYSLGMTLLLSVISPIICAIVGLILSFLLGGGIWIYQKIRYLVQGCDVERLVFPEDCDMQESTPASVIQYYCDDDNNFDTGRFLIDHPHPEAYQGIADIITARTLICSSCERCKKYARARPPHCNFRQSDVKYIIYIIFQSKISGEQYKSNVVSLPSVEESGVIYRHEVDHSHPDQRNKKKQTRQEVDHSHPDQRNKKKQTRQEVDHSHPGQRDKKKQTRQEMRVPSDDGDCQQITSSDEADSIEEYSNPDSHHPGAKHKPRKVKDRQEANVILNPIEKTKPIECEAKEEACIDPAGLQFMEKVRNQHLCRIECGGPTLHGLLDGEYVIFPGHFIDSKHPDKDIKVFWVQSIPNTHKSETHIGYIRRFVRHPDNSKDLAIGYLEDYSGKPIFRKKLSNYFINKTDLGLIDGLGLCYLPVHDTNHCCEIGVMTEYHGIASHASGPDVKRDYQQVVKIISATTHLVQSDWGDCGGPIVRLNPSHSRKLVGFHILASPEFNMAQLITQETVQMLKNLLVKPVEVPMKETSDTQHVEWFTVPDCPFYVLDYGDSIPLSSVGANVPGPNSTYLGDTPKVYAPTNGKTTLKRHPLYGAFPIKHVPAALTLSQVKNPAQLINDKFGNPSLILTQTSKYTTPDPKLSPKLKKFLRSYQKQMTEYLIDVFHGEDVGISSISEVANGIFNGNFHMADSKMKMDTSPGFPWTDTCSRKRDFFKEDENGLLSIDESTPHGKELLLNAATIFENAQNGYMTLTPWKDCLKDETRPIEKAEIGKTRVFTIPPIDKLLVTGLLFQKYKHHWIEHRNKLNHGVGMNPHSGEAAYHLKQSLVYNDVGFDADFRQFDGRLVKEFMIAVNNVRNSVIYNFEKKKHGEDLAKKLFLARQVIMAEIIWTPHLTYNNVWVTQHGNPSGGYLTTTINSDVNDLYVFWAYYQHTGKLSYTQYKKDLYVRTFGDDLWVVPGRHMIGFDFYLFQNIMKNDLNQIVTTADKCGSYSLKPLSELTFLKRQFIERGGVTLAPLDTDSIEQQFNWSHLPYNDTLQIDNQLNESMIEACLHGESYFQNFRARLLTKAREKFGEVSGTFRYSSLRLSYFDARSIFLERLQITSNTK